ncbi:hypothetical protein A2721_02700 [Candidatus Gottesmanbacteria bacterium RIFCSPHIGHO2_01_FULL_47_48]|uniref:Glycosyl hydrolase family 13 catalytic domain-containing protein n=1 Tax=Candidatus Gottesmanbacteria bacterium RIFCSPHIGHO2_01_FULL_47_48 TaxID=1798381 RepID=A0A1F6A4P8_9BACT|nr:MAG: hypothetical protein A2721_02700 [Candidatus Gottesmanbacteria bacterium RIFCSPHIGHO2_01_FULL_47_48]
MRQERAFRKRLFWRRGLTSVLAPVALFLVLILGVVAINFGLNSSTSPEPRADGGTNVVVTGTVQRSPWLRLRKPDYRLVKTDNGKDYYLTTTSTGINLRTYEGKKVVVTGTETTTAKWGLTLFVKDIKVFVAPPPPYPAQKKVDTSKTVMYQVWLNYYAQNVSEDQPSMVVFENAARRLPDLAKMGVTTIQLSPVHPFLSGTTIGSPYGSRDYYDVNPGYAGFTNPQTDPGTKSERIAAFKKYVEAAHGQGMKVIMDCVYHSTDARNVLVAAYPEYYKHNADGRFVQNQYGFYVLDYAQSELVDYMISMVKYWKQTVGVDGCRADVATMVPLAFWAALNNEMKKIDPGWLMIAETTANLVSYSGPYSGPGYKGETYDKIYGFDGIYGVTYMLASRAILNGSRMADVLETAWEFPQNGTAAVPGGIFYRSVDNHDQRPRATLLAGGNAGMVASVAVNLTLDGIPFIFNGQEIGDVAPTSIAVQRFISWSHPLAPQNGEAFEKLISLRRNRPALNSGTTVWLDNSNPAGVVSYVRQSGSDRVLVVANLSGTDWSGTVSGTTGASLSGQGKDLISGLSVSSAVNNVMTLSLPAYSYVVIQIQ